MTLGRRKRLAPDFGARPEIPEPCLAGLEASDDRVPRRQEMLGRMLVGRTVAASDVTALRTAPQMEPPRARGQTLPAALQSELALTRQVTRHPDFAEGVRAVVVDKDHRPAWTPARIEEVDPAVIQAILA